MVQSSLLSYFSMKKPDSRSTPNKRSKTEGGNSFMTPAPVSNSSMERSSPDLATASTTSGNDERTIVHDETSNLSRTVTPISTTITTSETPIPIRSSIKNNNNVIDLVSDNNDDGCSTERCLTYNPQKLPDQNNHDDSNQIFVKGGATERIRQEPDTDDDCLVVAPPCRKEKATSAGTLLLQTEEDDDVAFVGATAPNALEDFPHARQDCVIHPFSILQLQKYCANCYCFVCDIPASQCRTWSYHCNAKSGVSVWEMERKKERQKRKRKASTTTAGLTRLPLATSSRSARLPPPPLTITGRSQIYDSIYARVMPPRSSSLANLTARQQRMARWTRPPPTMTTTTGGTDATTTTTTRQQMSTNTPGWTRPSLASLTTTTQQQQIDARHKMVAWQNAFVARQSLANHTARQQGSAGWTWPPPTTTMTGGTDATTTTTAQKMVARQNAFVARQLQNTFVQALLQQVTQKPLYPFCRAPTSTFTTTLSPKQRQTLAFMNDVEARNEDSTGGWLALDDDGADIGKYISAIVLARVASDFHTTPSHDASNTLKTTVVLTSESLMGQWEDAVQKHAPGLKVRRFRPSSRPSKVPLDLREPESKWKDELQTVDVLISTATFAWPTQVTRNYTFHRVVMDEVHIKLAGQRMRNINHAKQIKACRKWCVTATRCITSIEDLCSQADFLCIGRQNSFGLALLRAQEANWQKTQQIQDTFGQLAPHLNKYMIRLEKSQLLGDGSEALS